MRTAITNVTKLKTTLVAGSAIRNHGQNCLYQGVPLGVPGSTNVLHVVRVVGDELERYTKMD